MNWNDLRYFLAVARDGQMHGAARRLGVSQALISRHISALEQATDARLLNRTTRGCSLTQDGRALMATAERIEGEMLSGLSKLKGSETVTGTVRIGAPDGFGSAFIAPMLGAFRDTYPELRVQLVPVARSFSLSEREADVAIMVGRPTKGRLRVRKLVDYTLGLYAAQSYVDRFGAPGEAGDLRSHTLIGYVDDLLHTPELNCSGAFFDDWRSDIEIATAMGQREAVSAGAGIGILHDFMAAGDADLVRILPALSAERSYWIVSHENMRAARAVQAVIELIDDAVSARTVAFRRT